MWNEGFKYFQKLLKFSQSDDFSPNPVTLVVGQPLNILNLVVVIIFWLL